MRGTPGVNLDDAVRPSLLSRAVCARMRSRKNYGSLAYEPRERASRDPTLTHHFDVLQPRVCRANIARK